MFRQRSFVGLLGLSLIWIAILIIQTTSKIGNPLRWVDVVIIFAFSFLAGTFYQRAMIARRIATTLPSEIPGGPPNIPK